ncbi:hypothetical protein BH24ACT10_BH24ACT10_18990 [soil metagenome]
MGATKAAEVLGKSDPVLLLTYPRCLETDDTEFQSRVDDACG